MNTCLCCTTPTTNPKFCNRSCAAKVNNANRAPRTLESKRKTSYTLKQSRAPYTKIAQCKHCNKWFERKSRTTCSRECFSALLSQHQTKRLKTDAEYRRKLGTSNRSFMETSFEQWLLTNFPSVEVRAQQQFRNETCTGYYYVDFFFPAAMLAIELDGTQHDTPENVVHDRKRDTHLATLGVSVLRITAREYKLKSRVREITSILENIATTQ